MGAPSRALIIARKGSMTHKAPFVRSHQVALSTGDRLAGGVWGHLVGDAMGVPYEFLAPDQILEVRWGARGTHNQPPGTWSDDGALMLALLDSLLSCGFDLADQAKRSLSWFETGA